VLEDPALPWKVIKLGLIGSTQAAAREYLASGYGAGTVIVAEGQTDGRGRRGQSWHSPEGGLYLTASLRPVGEIGLVPLMGGVAVAQVIRELANIDVTLKWPNDVLIVGKKVGGILAESGWAGGKVKHVLLGLGVNLNNPVPDWLPDATSLTKEIGEMVDVDVFLHRLLETLDLYLLRMESDPGLILSAWRESSLTLGKMVSVTDRLGEMVSGFAVDVDLDGSLIVDCGSEIKRMVSGVMEFR
jgi:BirA family biotin operon repressor/biotin-[acetyl-CoA-carboxylase] ligase